MPSPFRVRDALTQLAPRPPELPGSTCDPLVFSPLLRLRPLPPPRTPEGSCGVLILLVAPGSMGFPGSSAGKESTCSAGDPSSIPGSGRSPGEGIGYPLPCSWASLVAQLVKNPSAMKETWVRSLGREDPLGGGHGHPHQYYCLENPHGQTGRLRSMGSQSGRHC